MTENVIIKEIMNELWDKMVTVDVIMGLMSVLTLMVIDYAGVILAVLVDLRSGVLAAKEKGAKIVSKGYRRTVVKLMNYLMLLLALTSVDIMIMGISVCVNIESGWQLPVVPSLTTAGAVALGLIEAKSVRENSCAGMRDVAEAVGDAVENKSVVALLKWLAGSLKRDK